MNVTLSTTQATTRRNFNSRSTTHVLSRICLTANNVKTLAADIEKLFKLDKRQEILLRFWLGDFYKNYEYFDSEATYIWLQNEGVEL